MEMKHIVMWRVSGDTASERRINSVLIRNAFEELRGRIPGLLELEVGIDKSEVGYACEVVLYTRFQDAQSLAAYATHPAHLRVKCALGDIRTERYQVDYDFASSP